MTRIRHIAPALLLFLSSWPSNGSDWPPPPVLRPEEQLRTFRLAEPGLRVELVAADPMIQDPVAMTFDGEGRLWVVEMRGFMQDIDSRDVDVPNGRVSVLEDTDRDGRMDRSTVFADGLLLPRALSVHPDGVLIGEAETLRWFVDEDGDLVADRSSLVDAAYARDSIEHSSNGLYRALDNRIYNAKEGHRYRREGDGDWTREETEPRGQWGICQDDKGRLFYNYNHSQLHTDRVPPNAFSRHPHYTPSTGLQVSVTTSNRVFPVRPTPAANRGYIPGALDAEGRIKQFTSACAPLIYRGHAMPALRGNALVCEPVGNLIKRSLLSDHGIAVSGSDAHGAEDFLTSTDERFRPCGLANGPDGALYIVDMYRGVVQDGPHMSPYLRQHSIDRQMDRPVHLGRIWRVVPEGFKQPNPPQFSAMSTGELVESLAHPNGWWRDQAQRHLVEQDRQDAEAALLALAREGGEEARQHALWSLEGLGRIDPDRLRFALDDEAPANQTAALRVLQSLGWSDEKLVEAMEVRMTDPPAEEVALQMLITLGDLQIPNERLFPWMRTLLLPRAGDPLFRDATLTGLAGREVDFLAELLPRLPEEVTTQPGLAFLLESLSRIVLQSRDSEAILRLLGLVPLQQEDWRHQSLVAGVRLLDSDLRQHPVRLTAEPELPLADWEHYFSWPGHRPGPPPQPDARPLTPKEQGLLVQGRQIYVASCVACHGQDGAGMKLLAPPLAGSDWVLGSPERLSRILFHGLMGPITVSGTLYQAPEIQPLMPPLANLSNTDIAAVLTYIRREWGNRADPISPGEVNQIRIQAQGRTTPWTEPELAPFAEEE